MRNFRVESYSARFVSLLLVALVVLTVWVGAPSNAALAQGISLPAEINKSFTPITIIAGQVSRLSVTIYNPNAFPLTNAAWTDNMPAGIFLANPVNSATTCGGTVTGVPGASTFSLSGGTVPAQVGPHPGSCTVSVDVSSITPGNLINVIPANGLTSTGGGVSITNTTPASATLQVNAVQPPSLNKNFSPNTIWAGNTSVLTINILNNDLNNALTNVNLTDSMPTNVKLASPVVANLTNCGAGVLTAVSGASTFTLSGASIPKSSTCVIKVNVTSTVQGSYNNTIPASAITSAQGVTNASSASATLNVQMLSVTKNFVATTLVAGSTTPLTITLSNPTNADYTGVHVSDTLPAPFIIAASPAPVNTCGGTLTATPGTSLIDLTGGTIPRSAAPPAVSTCSITVTVTAPLSALTVGQQINTIPAGNLTTDQGITNPSAATDSMAVQAALVAGKSFSPVSISPGGITTVSVTLRNYTSAAFTGVNLTDTLPAGLTVVGTPTTPQCGGVITNDATSVTITGGTIAAGATCTITFQVTASATGPLTNTIPVGSVTTNQGATNVTQASTTVTVASSVLPVNSAKSFLPTTISPGGNTRLRIDVTAPADSPLTNLSITDVLPGGMTVSNSTAPSITGCGAGRVFTAPTGATSVLLTNGTVLAGQVCRIDVYVTTSTPGISTNSIPAANITYTEARPLNPPAPANLIVTGLSMSKAFYPPTVNPNGFSRLTITLTNSALSRLVSASLTDSLPTNVYVAATPNAVSTCGGTLSAVANSQTISLTNGIIPAKVGSIAGVCTVSVDVQGRGAAATRTNTIPIGNLSATIEDDGTVINPIAAATANLTIGNLHIVVNKAFNPLTVHGGSASVMSIELRNPDNAVLSGIQFTDTMPAGMVIANPPNFDGGTCGATPTGVIGSNVVSFSGGTLAASSACTMTLNVTMNVNGNLTNTIPVGAVTTFNGVANTSPAAASLTNLPGASVNKYFADRSILAGPGSSTLLTISIQNTSSFALTGLGLIDTLPAGLQVAGAPAPVNNCAGTLTALPGTQNIQLSGGALLGNSTCTLVVPVNGPLPGTFTNTIPTGSLTNNEGTTNTEPTSDTLTLTGVPALNVTKTLTSTGPLTLGSTLSYDIIVENTGNIALSDVTVTDPGVGAVLGVCSPAQPATLAPGASMTCAATHIITQADIDAGSYTNPATADSAETPTDTDSETVTIPQTYALNVTKTQNAAGPFTLGSTLTYEIVAANTGNTTLTGVTITEAGVGVTLGACTPDQPATLAPGDALTCAATHVVTQADVDAGSYTNTATGDSEQTPPDSDDETVTIAQNPALNLTKTLTATGPFALGSSLTYDIIVENTGTVTLTGVTITDAGEGVTLGACTPEQPATLAPGATMTCTASHAVTQVDVDAGTYSNTATGDSDQTAPDSDTETVAIAQNPALNVTKTLTVTGPFALGSTLTYDIVATNTGTVTLTGVTVSDPSAVIGTCTPAQPATLAPGAAMTCPASHIVTQGDVDAGTYTNTATADSDQTGPDSDSETVTIAQNPALNVTKTLTTTGPFALGSTLIYDIVVENTGTVTLTGVIVTDAGADVTLGGCIPAQPATLAPGARMTCTASHAVTQADVDAGTYSNTATGDSDQTTPDSDTETVVIAQNPAMDILKTAVAGTYALGDSIPFSIEVTNSGDVTLTGVTITDPGVGAVLGTCSPAQPATLAPGDTLSCSASHLVTQGDVDAGSYSNTAFGVSDQTPPESDTETVTIAQNPAMDVTKTITAVGPFALGSTLTYDIVATNTGDVTLTSVTITDAGVGVTLGVCTPGQPATLAPGSTLTCAASYIVTQADVDAGTYTNTATGESDQTPPVTDDETVTIAQNPAQDVTKTLTASGPFALGSTLTYDIVATNTGTVTLTGVTISDPSALVGVCTPAQPATLAPGAAMTCPASYIVTQADVDAGSYTNTATADSDQTGPDSDSETVTIAQNPAFAVTKTITATGPFALGSTLTYDIVATNTGTVTLTGVTVSDPSAVVGACTPAQPATLAPGATMTCPASFTVTQAEVDAGSYSNTATADSDQTPPVSDSETVAINQTPALNVTKTLTAVGPFTLNSTLTYDIVVTNTGTVTLSGVTVTDPGATVGTCTPAQPATLLPGGTMTCPASYVVTQTDVDAGSFTNTATADSDQTPSDSDSETVMIAQTPAILLEKTGVLNLGSDNIATVGDMITYRFTVTNTGTVALFNITLSDALIDITGGPIASLAPGAVDSTTFTGTYTLTQADIDNGFVTNTATVRGSGPSGAVSDEDDDTREIIVLPLLGVAKRVVGAPVSVSPGVWDVTFEIIARNYGTVTLTNLQVTDDLSRTFPGPTTFSVRSVTSSDFKVNTSFNGASNTNLLAGSDTLAVGKEGKLSLVVRVVPAAAGPYNNTAVGSATTPDQQPVTDDSQNGTDPDSDKDGDPTNNEEPTPVVFDANLFDPPFGVKVVSASGSSLRWTMTWINNTNIVAVNAEASDGIPTGTTFINNGVPSGYPLPAGAPTGSTANGVSCVDTSQATSTQFCYYEGPTSAFPRGRIVWNGTLGPDFGAQDAAAAANEIAISFSVRVSNDVTKVTNTAVIDSDLNGDGDVDDPGEQEVAEAEARWQRPVSDVKELPDTGFAPGTVTRLPSQPVEMRYSSEALTLEIPAIGARMAVVGVPQSGKGWDVTWLGSGAGWLNGTAYPTWMGNSVITGHVWDAFNKPGPFAQVKTLKYGDEIRIHAGGQVYIYAVRENRLVKPNETQSVFKHEEQAWVTLLTCEDYNTQLDNYANRRLVRAVLVKVLAEK